MSQLDQQEMGIGTWAWGDKGVWGYGQGYDDSDLHETFLAAVNAGAHFFDTAEIYGDGLSETYLGRFMKERPDVTFYTATKFMPFPWKVGTSHLLKSLKASLKRLDLKQVDLYQIHFPMPFRSIEAWLEPLAQAVKDGLVKEVGVSNYSRSQMLRAFPIRFNTVWCAVKWNSTVCWKNVKNPKLNLSPLVPWEWACCRENILPKIRRKGPAGYFISTN
jgi:aryl-alcohol dehydrogenase-like predicted oxidoreductase